MKKLRDDPVLAVLIDKFGVINDPPSTDRFESLVGSIIGQQLSNKAADTIYSRVEKVTPIDPQSILNTDPQSLRAAGMSWAKINSLRDLSKKVLDGTLQLNKLDAMSDEEVVAHLTKVKGIGRWTAEMKLMFTLQRPDVFPLDDRGIQNAMIRLYGLKDGKKLKDSMLSIAEAWRPFRTLACWYLWKSLDNA